MVYPTRSPDELEELDSLISTDFIAVTRGNRWYKLPADELAFEGVVDFEGINFTGSVAPKNGIYLPAANTLGFSVNDILEWEMTNTAYYPSSNDGSSLGKVGKGVSDGYFADGAVLWFNDDYKITHTSVNGNKTLDFNGIVQSSGATSLFQWNFTGGAANEKYARMYAYATGLVFGFINDAYTVENAAFQLYRS